MQKVLYTGQIQEYSQYLEPKMIDYIAQGQTEAFEGFENFDLMAFDWYDVHASDTGPSKILIYADREDLFFFCEDERGYSRVQPLLADGQSNERALYLFFVGLLKNDMSRLDALESEITDSEDAALRGTQSDYLQHIRDYRRELLRMKRYYQQLGYITDNLTANDNGLFTKAGVRSFAIIGNRLERFLSDVMHLRDYVTQMREACQAQLDLEQNNLMRVFTVITAVFLPLTLIVGWYGMNFDMPELSWHYGYPLVIALSAAVCAGLLMWFKHKKWF